MAGSRLGFDRNQIQLHQVLGVRLTDDGHAGMPLRPNWETRPSAWDAAAASPERPPGTGRRGRDGPPRRTTRRSPEIRTAPVQVAEHIAALRAEGPLLARAAERAGPDAPVPACPGWRMRDLVRHVGNVHRWATGYVVEQHPAPVGG